MRKLLAVDLFAGCGGLTLGIRQAGFAVKCAVENDRDAALTYKRNHRATTALVQDIAKVTGEDIDKALQGEPLSLLVGCAPCQGFTSLTRKWRRPDPRNQLLMEMARLIRETQPSAVMMENVVGVTTVGAEIYQEFLACLSELGYFVQAKIVQMADYGVPQNRRRLVLLAGRGFVIPFPAPTHSRQVDDDSDLQPWITVRELLAGRRPAAKLPRAKRLGGPQQLDWHVVRDLHPQTRARLKAAIPGKTWLSVDESKRPKCHRGGYIGFTNVYGRMVWDEVSPTITSGCTTPAKGRFGHPDRRRSTISVREAALLQTFPERYKFAIDHIDSVCEMIGNAVPPRFAFAVGRAIKKTLSAHQRALARRAQ